MSRTQLRTLRWPLIFLLAVGFTWLCVQHLQQKGRLSNVPNYDDVTYFAPATDLVESVREGGIDGLKSFLFRDWLHSPYSIGLAAAAYFIGGENDAAPYAANVVVVIAYLLGIGYFARKCGAAEFFLLLWIGLTLPFAAMAVAEFRPDLAWAMVTGFTVVFTLTREDFFERGRNSLIFGVLAGIDLLIKPSTFAMTLLALGAAFGGRWLVEFARVERETAWRVALPRAAAALGMGGLVASPYYFFHWRDTWQYFYTNSFGRNAGVWTAHGNRWHQWLFYVSRPGASSNFGRVFYLVEAGIVALLIWQFRRSGRVGRLQIGFLALIMGMIYGINSMANAKTCFLGGAFYGTMIFSAAFVAGQALETPGRWPFRILLTTALAMTALYQWPRYSEWGKEPATLVYLDAGQKVEACLASLPQPRKVLVAQQGPLIPENLSIWYLRRHQRTEVLTAAFVGDLEKFESLAATADIVVAQDKQTLGATGTLPVEGILDGVARRMKENEAFTLVQAVPIADGKRLYFFGRRTYLKPAG